MFVWAPTLWMVILWWEGFSVFIVRGIESLFGWLYLEDGFLMWLRRRYMLLRLSVYVNVSVGSVLVCSVAMKIAYNYALRILGYLGRRATILTCSGPLKTLTTTILFFHSSSGGVNKPSI